MDLKDAEVLILDPKIKPRIDNTYRTAPPLAEGKDLKYNRELSWYYDENNIPNQQLVTQTVTFLIDHKSDIVAPLDFLNLLERQIDLLKQHLGRADDYIKHLKRLPISQEILYTLLGMLLKWHGGYPINNLNEDYNTILLLVEDEFIRMHPQRDTLEAEFCKADPNLRGKMSEIEDLFNNRAKRPNVEDPPRESSTQSAGITYDLSPTDTVSAPIADQVPIFLGNRPFGNYTG